MLPYIKKMEELVIGKVSSNDWVSVNEKRLRNPVCCKSSQQWKRSFDCGDDEGVKYRSSVRFQFKKKLYNNSPLLALG